MNKFLVYITCETVEEAEKIGNYIVKNRLAACVNIIDNMKSIYHWKGKIESSDEVIIIAKTKEDLIDKLIKEVKNIHSYEVPCIVALPITKGNPDFLKWIGDECI